jgi:hypothetical protein
MACGHSGFTGGLEGSCEGDGVGATDGGTGRPTACPCCVGGETHDAAHAQAVAMSTPVGSRPTS